MVMKNSGYNLHESMLVQWDDAANEIAGLVAMIYVIRSLADV